MQNESPLDLLLEDGVIDEVVGRLKSGKEADIYLVRHAGRTVAAKVYKDPKQRSFKNNADYKEGRGVRSSRTRRAIETGSRFGRQASERAWRTAESDALHLLYRSGVRVPEPILFYEGVLLMVLVTDAEGRPAPRLIELSYDQAAARALYVELRGQIIKMLCCEVIHGDLSPYNILAAEGGATIIDFPQVISVAHSSRAEHFFQRDFQNVLQFLTAADPTLAAQAGEGRQIWNAYTRRDLTPDFVPPPPDPRRDERPRHAPRPHHAQPPSQSQRSHHAPPPPQSQRSRHAPAQPPPARSHHGQPHAQPHAQPEPGRSHHAQPQPQSRPPHPRSQDQRSQEHRSQPQRSSRTQQDTVRPPQPPQPPRAPRPRQQAQPAPDAPDGRPPAAGRRRRRRRRS